MSRSRKKIPIIANAGVSDKVDKRLANRAVRAAVRAALLANADVVDINTRDVSDSRGFSKDGKKWPKHLKEEHWRK